MTNPPEKGADPDPRLAGLTYGSVHPGKALASGLWAGAGDVTPEGDGLEEGVEVCDGLEVGVAVCDGLERGVAGPVPELILPQADRTITEERTTVSPD